MKFNKGTVRDYLTAKGLIVMSLHHVPGMKRTIIAETVKPGIQDCPREDHVVTPLDLGIIEEEEEEGGEEDE